MWWEIEAEAEHSLHFCHQRPDMETKIGSLYHLAESYLLPGH